MRSRLRELGRGYSSSKCTPALTSSSEVIRQINWLLCNKQSSLSSAADAWVDRVHFYLKPELTPRAPSFKTYRIQIKFGRMEPMKKNACYFYRYTSNRIVQYKN